MAVGFINLLVAHGGVLALAVAITTTMTALVIGREERYFRPRGAWAIAADLGLLVVFVGALAAGYFGARVRHELGARVGAWELRSISTGASRRLADYRGTPVVLNVWATWCGPCREEMPALNALADRHRGRDAIVLAATDESIEEIRAFEREATPVKADVVTFRDERAPLGMVGAMAYEGRPTTVIVDRDGAVRHVLAGPQSYATLERALREVL